MKVIPEMRCAH